MYKTKLDLSLGSPLYMGFLNNYKLYYDFFSKDLKFYNNCLILLNRIFDLLELFIMKFLLEKLLG